MNKKSGEATSVSNVVSLDSRRPHHACPAVCISCKFEFTAVAPAGVLWFDCPECGLEKATWKHTFSFVKGTLIRSCDCGNALFFQSQDGILCALCGKMHEVHNLEKQAMSSARLKEELDKANKRLERLLHE